METLIIVDEIGQDLYCWQVIDEETHSIIDMGYEKKANIAAIKAEEVRRKAGEGTPR